MSDPKLLYQVTATIDSQDDCEAYVAWLRDGHIEDVVAAGALSGTVAVQNAESGNGSRVVCSYIFKNASSFAAYESGPATALRAEGVALFGPDSGRSLTWSRFVGEVVFAVGNIDVT